MADLFTTIQESSSIRAYQPKALSDEQIGALIDAGLRAPTARNEQELHFTVLNTAHPLAAEIQNALNPNAAGTFYYGAPTLVLISGADDFKWSRLDAGIAVENIHLAAKGMGLGSVVIGCIDGVLTGEKKAYFNEKLGIPAGYSFEIALAVGYPATTKVQHEFDAARQVNYIG